MTPPASLPAALLQHAAADPEAPGLFRAEGWDWVWHPWRELAGWLARWRQILAVLPPGSPAAFRGDARPESLVLDLAVQAAGLVSVPGERREGDAWIERREREIGVSPPAPPVPSPRETDAGGAVVRTGGHEAVWTAAGMVAAGESLRAEIGAAGRRDVVVLGGALTDPLERTMLAWALLAGAAVVLEPDPARRAATAAWVRPTVFHGSPAEIADLRARAGKARKGRLPFRRLRAVVASAEVPAEEAALWRERGTRLLLPRVSLRSGSAG